MGVNPFRVLLRSADSFAAANCLAWDGKGGLCYAIDPVARLLASRTRTHTPRTHTHTQAQTKAKTHAHTPHTTHLQVFVLHPHAGRSGDGGGCVGSERTQLQRLSGSREGDAQVQQHPALARRPTLDDGHLVDFLGQKGADIYALEAFARCDGQQELQMQ